MNFIEILGYVAMILVSVSFLLKDILKLRTVNAAGAICFIIYGLLTNSMPVVGVNIFVACANIYYILQLIKNKQQNTAS